jgi:hypothetical protein
MQSTEKAVTIPFTEEDWQGGGIPQTRKGDPVHRLFIFKGAEMTTSFIVYGIVRGAIHRWRVNGFFMAGKLKNPQDLVLRVEQPLAEVKVGKTDPVSFQDGRSIRPAAPKNNGIMLKFFSIEEADTVPPGNVLRPATKAVKLSPVRVEILKHLYEEPSCYIAGIPRIMYSKKVIRFKLVADGYVTVCWLDTAQVNALLNLGYLKLSPKPTRPERIILSEKGTEAIKAHLDKAPNYPR